MRTVEVLFSFLSDFSDLFVFLDFSSVRIVQGDDFGVLLKFGSNFPN
jgi:hypothetical protein